MYLLISLCIYTICILFFKPQSQTLYLPAYQSCVVPIPAYQILYITPFISTSGSEWLFTSMSTLCIYLAVTAQINLFYKYQYPQASFVCSSSHKQAHSMTAAISIWQLVTKLVYISYLLRGDKWSHLDCRRIVRLLMSHWGARCYNVAMHQMKPSHCSYLIPLTYQL